MIRRKTPFDLRTIAIQGGSLDVDGRLYSAFDLRTVALSLQPGATLTIRNSDSKTAFDLMTISSAKPGQVISA